MSNQETTNFELEDKCYTVVRKLIKLREAKGLTTYQLAELSGLKQPNISRIESMHSKPALESLVKIATALDVEIEFVPKVK